MKPVDWRLISTSIDKLITSDEENGSRENGL